MGAGAARESTASVGGALQEEQLGVLRKMAGVGGQLGVVVTTTIYTGGIVHDLVGVPPEKLGKRLPANFIRMVIVNEVIPAISCIDGYPTGVRAPKRRRQDKYVLHLALVN